MTKNILSTTDTCSDKPEVAHVIWSLGLGGAEQMVLSLTRALTSGSFRPIVVCLNDEGSFAEQARSAGVEVFAMHKRRGLDAALPWKLASFFRQRRTALVHTHLFNGHLWGRLAARMAGIPWVATEHGMDGWRTPLHHAADAILGGDGSRMVYVSEETRAFYRRRVPGRRASGHVIFNGIDPELFRDSSLRSAVRASFGFTENDFVIGTAGRFVPEKRHDIFLEVIERLRVQGYPVKALVAGDGPLKEKVMEQARRLGLSEVLKLTGFRKDMPAVYPAMDVFVLTSDREGFPITVLEAMASGLPVVSSNVGGIHECVIPGENGDLVQPGNADGFVHAISSIYRKRGQLSWTASREKISRLFSTGIMARNYELLYQEVLS
ncbi:MAG: glycosyltransferase [Candidatus Omnitrophica bacterium]|nr:glycosyltransferase [Candidatus Omnitrophota bacterium]